MTTVISGSYPAINSDSDATVNGLTVGRGGGALVSNTVLGVSAGSSNTTGAYNTFVGGQDALTGRAAGQLNTTGNINTALGNGALAANSTGSNNTAVGYRALAVSTVSDNTALGTYSLYTNTTGTANVAVGRDALQANTTASNNTAVGYQAGYSTTTASTNVFIGGTAGYTNSTGNSNTIIGQDAGSALNTSSNTLIGKSAGSEITTGSKNTILGRYNGNQGGLNIATSSNYIVLSDGDGNPRVMTNPSGYTKISNNAGWDATNTFHEIVQTAADSNLYIKSTGANPFGVVIAYTGAAPNANSNAYLTCQDNSGGGRVTVRIWSNGNMQNLNNSYGALSDQAIKENIVDATPKLADLMQVKIRNFNLIGNEIKQIGVIAQELETVFPSMVESTEDGFKGVKYSVFVPMLIKAVQELNAKVEAQAAEIAALKGANNG